MFELKEVLSKSDNLVFGSREFCDLWIIIHQLSPIRIKDLMAIDDHIFAKAFESSLSGYDTIEVEALEEEISVRDHYFMKNMRMKLGSDNNDG